MTIPVALVTGAAKGIGAAVARNLAADHRIALTHLSTPPTRTVASCAPAQVLALEADLAQEDSAQQVIDRVIAQYGRLDLIVNNAGAITGNSPEKIPSGLIARQFAVNVTAPAQLLAAALPHLRRGASVVNITSCNARLPALSAPMYSASKAALETWTRAMAKVLGPKGIRVNAVAPGAINTPETPRDAALTALFVEATALGALATPDDIASAVRFLASADACAITGVVLDVSAGYRL